MVLKPYFSSSPKIIKLLSQKSLVWNIPTNEKVIYLTFDDGPVPDVTPKVLDILDCYDIKATFFCVGENISKHPDIFQKVIDKGHKIGNHSYNHLKGWITDNQDYYKNIKQFDDIYKTDLFRPPYGKISPHQIYDLKQKYSIVLWSVLTYDYDKNVSPFNCLNIAIDNSSNGSIVVFHDSIKASRNMLYALPKFIERMKERGYRFEMLSKEIINEHKTSKNNSANIAVISDSLNRFKEKISVNLLDRFSSQ